eukprot:g1309.t1
MDSDDEEGKNGSGSGGGGGGGLDLTPDEAAQKIQGMYARGQSREQLKLLLKSIVVRKVDPESGEVYYINTRNGQRTTEKPRILGDDDDLVGEPWTCARCGKFNGEGPLKCGTCGKARNESEAEDRARKAAEKAEEESAKRDYEARRKELEEAERMRRLEAEDRQLPDPPSGVGAEGGDTQAGVWWTPGRDNGKPLLKFVVKRYRRDGDDWLVRKETELGPEVTSTTETGLTNGREYRFCVVGVNADGPSEDSKPSNMVLPAVPLPEGWTEVKAPDGKVYYANKALGVTSWKKPQEDAYKVPSNLKKILSEDDIKRYKAHFMDIDGDRSGSIDERELGNLLKGLNVKVTAKKLAKLVKHYDADESGMIEFGEFVALIHDVQTGKSMLGSVMGGFLSRVKKVGEKVGVVHEVDRAAEESRKFGAWVQYQDPNLGKPYYYNKLTNETSWTRPLEVIYFLPPELKDKFTPDEITEFQESFAAFDTDDSGAIELDECAAIFADLGEQISSTRLKKLFTEMDDDNSGELEFDEFVKMVHKVRHGGLFNALKGGAHLFGSKKKAGETKGGSSAGSGSDDELDTVRHYKRVLYPPLNAFLKEHKLLKYEPVLVSNGFETVEAMLLMKDQDLDQLGLLLGHKRKLQAALSTWRRK